jgi:hypothetical protein
MLRLPVPALAIRRNWDLHRHCTNRVIVVSGPGFRKVFGHITVGNGVSEPITVSSLSSWSVEGKINFRIRS